MSNVWNFLLVFGFQLLGSRLHFIIFPRSCLNSVLSCSMLLCFQMTVLSKPLIYGVCEQGVVLYVFVRVLLVCSLHLISPLCPHPCRIGKQFEFTLLLQSVVMIITMFAMLHLCCVFQNTNRMGTKQHRLSGEGFWQAALVQCQEYKNRQADWLTDWLTDKKSVL